MSYKKPEKAPAISRQEAIDSANKHAFGLQGKDAPQVYARHELLSQEDPEVWKSVLEAKGLDAGKGFTDVPVWVVSYEGVRIYGSGAGGPNPNLAPGEGQSLDTLPMNRELNVVVSAETGQVLASFTYR